MKFDEGLGKAETFIATMASAAGNLIANYNYLPDDHYAKLGASFQKYLAGKTDRAGFAKEITDYWKSVK